ncbi:MAG TPA: sulfatase-like hydrolase/transferase [Chthoniobacterales bacterium]|nr:sulfatase-like hydrolase/transferase [Chthoniobacterales bacterium]
MSAQSSKSPFNLIVFLPDQQRVDTLACYGNAKVHAPNLNKLAAESVVFERAYVTQPVCSPSRASLLTGWWPHTSGCTNNGFPVNPRIPALPQLIDGNYRAGYIGKWHLRDLPPTQRGFHEWVSVEGLSDYSQFLVEQGVTPDLRNGSFSALTISNLPLELSQAEFLRRHACGFIERNKNTPFILVISFVEPHSPYNGPFNSEHHLGESDLDGMAAPFDPDMVPLRYRLLREWQNDKASKETTGVFREFRFGLSPEDYVRIKQRYYGLITLIDRSIGSILGTLDNVGLMDRTVIAHTSDHGDLLGDHGLFGKGVMYEQAVCVPLLIRVPGARHNIVKRRVSHIDFVPTLLELLDQQEPDWIGGQSLAPLIYGDNSPQRNVFIEWNPYKKEEKRLKPGTSIASPEMINRAIRESTRTVIAPDGWKLNLRDNDLCELYNLHDDPLEERNLYDVGQFGQVIERCRTDILRWQQDTGDSVPLKLS